MTRLKNTTIGVFLLYGLSMLNVPAEVVVQKIQNNQVPVWLESTLSSKKTKVGDEVKVTLPENVILEDRIIPAFSILTGHVEKSYPSRRLGRNAYISMSFNKICVPAHQETEMSPSSPREGELQCYELKDNHKSVYPYRPERTFKSIVFRQLPIAVASAATAITLGCVGGFGFAATWGIEHGVGAVTGIAQEVVNRKNKHSVSYKAGDGVFRSTGIPFFYEMLTKDKSFEYPPGTILPVHFQPELLKEMIAKTDSEEKGSCFKK